MESRSSEEGYREGIQYSDTAENSSSVSEARYASYLQESEEGTHLSKLRAMSGTQAIVCIEDVIDTCLWLSCNQC